MTASDKVLRERYGALWQNGMVAPDTILLANSVRTAKLIQTGRGQAVLLPEDFRFDGKRVFIKKAGNAVVLIPMANPWDSLLGSLDKFSDDFPGERE